MNNKLLLIVFLALLGVYGLSKVFNTKKERSFKTELIQIDSTKVSSVVITPKGATSSAFTLKKEDNGWIGSRDNINIKATPTSIEALLSNLSGIRTKRIAAKSPEKWVDYEVEEGNGRRIQVFYGEKMIEDFILGRFSFNQQNRTATSFIRLNGEDEVYAVDGFMGMTLGQGFDAYRDKTMLRIPAEAQITSFSYQYQDTTLNFNVNEGQWLLNETIALDSSKIVGFLNGLSALNGNDFADTFDDLQSNALQYATFTAEGNNLTAPIVINCYRDTTQEKPYILKSSFNQEAYFASDSAGIFPQIFKDISAFTAE